MAELNAAIERSTAFKSDHRRIKAMPRYRDPGMRFVASRRLSHCCTITIAVVLIAVALPGAAVAADPDMPTRMQEAHLTPGIMFSLPFLMIGPISRSWCRLSI